MRNISFLCDAFFLLLFTIKFLHMFIVIILRYFNFNSYVFRELSNHLFCSLLRFFILYAVAISIYFVDLTIIFV